MNSLKVNLMSLITEPTKVSKSPSKASKSPHKGSKYQKRPSEFQDWITIELSRMDLSQVTRLYDSKQEIKFGQITLIDATVPACHRTLIYQTTNEFSESDDQQPADNQYSLEVKISKVQEKSSAFKGCLYDIDVKLSNVNFKFMPGSIN